MIRKILRFYTLILSLFIGLGSIVLGLQSGQIIFPIFFLPVVLYFILTIFKLKRGLKLFLYYDFILITIMAIMGFVNISSTPQLISAIVFMPMALYFWLLVLPKRNKKLPIPDTLPAVIHTTEIKENKIIEEDVKKLEEIKPNTKFGKGFDLDRRMFLKLIGSTGLMVFIFSIFTQKAEGAFFGSAPTGPGVVALKDAQGDLIDPAIKTPTDGYKITQLDDSTPAYYGFLEKTGKWFIMREEINGDYRYAKGDNNFSSNWTNRASLTYGYFDAIF